jgi:hypothetical protein
MYDWRKSQADGTQVAGGSATIIPFPHRRPLLHRRLRPIIDPLRQFEQDEDRRRMRQNLAAGVVVALLVTLGFWLIDGLTTSGHIAVCFESGHQHCQSGFWHHL